MGTIREDASHQFTIYPEGHAFETMADMHRGPYASLDAALAEIERHTRGVCRRSTGEDQHQTKTDPAVLRDRDPLTVPGACRARPHGRVPVARG